MKRASGILIAVALGFIAGVAVPLAGAHPEIDCPPPPPCVCPTLEDLTVKKVEAAKKALKAINAYDNQMQQQQAQPPTLE